MRRGSSLSGARWTVKLVSSVELSVHDSVTVVPEVWTEFRIGAPSGRFVAVAAEAGANTAAATPTTATSIRMPRRCHGTPRRSGAGSSAPSLRFASYGCADHHAWAQAREMLAHGGTVRELDQWR